MCCGIPGVVGEMRKGTVTLGPYLLTVPFWMFRGFQLVVPQYELEIAGICYPRHVCASFEGFDRPLSIVPRFCRLAVRGVHPAAPSTSLRSPSLIGFYSTRAWMAVSVFWV